MGRYSIDGMSVLDPKSALFDGSISLLNRMELSISTQYENIGNTISLKNRETGEIYKGFLASDVCISDDGMYLIKLPREKTGILPGIIADLYLLDWDWKERETDEEILPAELHYDIAKYKRFVKKNIKVSYARIRKEIK